MYRLTLVFSFLLFSNAFCQERSIPYRITGYLTNLNGRTVYLFSRSQATSASPNPILTPVDSSSSNDGHFTFQGKFREEKYYAIGIKGKNQERFKSFILDNTPLTLNGDADSIGQVSITGSEVLQLAEWLQKQLDPLQKRRNEVEMLRNNAIQKGDKTTDWVYANESESIAREIVALKESFIDQYPRSILSLFELQSIVGNLPKSEARSLWTRLDYSLQQHSVGKQIHDQVIDQSSDPGQQTPNIILSDLQDKPVSLLSYKGKVLLIDFWASWCDHCRQEHTRLKSLYDQYKDRGLQIISISIDDDPKAWKKALHTAGLPWTQLTDRIGSKNVIGGQYGTNSIPINLLIDKEGTIIRKGLHGTELDRQLALVFNAP